MIVVPLPIDAIVSSLSNVTTADPATPIFPAKAPLAATDVISSNEVAITARPCTVSVSNTSPVMVPVLAVRPLPFPRAVITALSPISAVTASCVINVELPIPIAPPADPATLPDTVTTGIFVVACTSTVPSASTTTSSSTYARAVVSIRLIDAEPWKANFEATAPPPAPEYTVDVSSAVIDTSPDDTATSVSATPAMTRSSKSLKDRANPIPTVPPKFTASVPAIERISLSLSAATFTALTATTPSPLPLCRPSIVASLVPDNRLTETAPAPAILF